MRSLKSVLPHDVEPRKLAEWPSLAEVEIDYSQSVENALLGWLQTSSWAIKKITVAPPQDATDAVQLVDEGDGDEFYGKPASISIYKAADEGAARFFSADAAAAWLSDHPSEWEMLDLIEVAELPRSIELAGAIIRVWQQSPFHRIESGYATPPRIVRDLSNGNFRPRTVDRWVLADGVGWNEGTLEDAIIATSAKRLVCALASEVWNEDDGARVAFKAHRTPILSLDNGEPSREMAVALQQAAAWVYQNKAEADIRHGLLAAEIARDLSTGVQALHALSGRIGPALAQARHAWSLHLQGISSDNISLLTGLKSALGDDLRLIYGQISAVISTLSRDALVTVGVVLLRFLDKEINIVVGVAAILFIALSGLISLRQALQTVDDQIAARAAYRNDLYGYVDDEDYRRLYEDLIVDARGRMTTAIRCAGAAYASLGFLIACATI